MKARLERGENATLVSILKYDDLIAKAEAGQAITVTDIQGKTCALCHVYQKLVGQVEFCPLWAWNDGVCCNDANGTVWGQLYKVIAGKGYSKATKLTRLRNMREALIKLAEKQGINPSCRDSLFSVGDAFIQIVNGKQTKRVLVRDKMGKLGLVNPRNGDFVTPVIKTHQAYYATRQELMEMVGSSYIHLYQRTWQYGKR